MSFDRKSLNELEGVSPGPPVSNDSYIETACFELRKKPLNEMNVEDLRILIAQGIGLKFLMPMALKVLAKEPLAEGMHYPGDLLASVLRAPSQFFAQNPISKSAAEAAYREAERQLCNRDEIDRRYAAEGLDEAWAAFKRQLSD